MKPYPTIEEVEKRVGMRARSWRYAWPADIIRHICDLDREWREAPAEDRIDWAAYPWAKWAAKDLSGRVAMYASKPYRSKVKKIDDQWYARGDVLYQFVDATIPGPWQDSLRARPEGGVMQYLLTEQEYQELRSARAERDRIDRAELQALCTMVANHVPVKQSWRDGAPDEPVGCTIDAEARGEEWYCDDCPAQKLCPYPNKEWSK